MELDEGVQDLRRKLIKAHSIKHHALIYGFVFKDSVVVAGGRIHVKPSRGVLGHAHKNVRHYDMREVIKNLLGDFKRNPGRSLHRIADA